MPLSRREKKTHICTCCALFHVLLHTRCRRQNPLIMSLSVCHTRARTVHTQRSYNGTTSSNVPRISWKVPRISWLYHQLGDIRDTEIVTRVVLEMGRAAIYL